MKHSLRFLILLCTCALATCGSPNPAETENVDDPTVVEPSVETNAAEVQVHPIFHGAVVLTTGERTIFVDPYGGAERFTQFGAPDVVLITHTHSDHLNPETLRGLELGDATLIAPQSVVDELGDITFGEVRTMANGDELSIGNLDIDAIAMYNLPESPDAFHPKGKFNGYVVEISGDRYYFSGDTEDIEEMRNLEDIDVAFVCMNQPYTMTVEQAADATLAFKPEVVYPYHFRNGDGSFSDVDQFKQLVNAGDKSIQVMMGEWYAEPGK